MSSKRSRRAKATSCASTRNTRDLATTSSNNDHKEEDYFDCLKVEDFHGVYSPILFCPKSVIALNQPQEYTPQKDIPQEKKVTKNQKRRQKLKMKKQLIKEVLNKSRNDSIHESTDSSMNSSSDSMNGSYNESVKKFVNVSIKESVKESFSSSFEKLTPKERMVVRANTCCGKEYCHHYAYQGSYSSPFVAFQENFYNRNRPNLFALLQGLFSEFLMDAVKNNVREPKIMYDRAYYYMCCVSALGVRRLNCISCLQLIIELTANQHIDFMKETSYQENDLYAFFFDLDSGIVNIVFFQDYCSDAEESSPAHPVENYVYQSLYFYLCNYLYDLYIYISETLNKRFGSVHAEILKTRPVMSCRNLVHLGLLAKTINRTRVLELTKCRPTGSGV